MDVVEVIYLNMVCYFIILLFPIIEVKIALQIFIMYETIIYVPLPYV